MFQIKQKKKQVWREILTLLHLGVTMHMNVEQNEAYIAYSMITENLTSSCLIKLKNRKKNILAGGSTNTQYSHNISSIIH